LIGAFISTWVREMVTSSLEMSVAISRVVTEP